ncbi:HNH endonuclease [Streptoverticillium reticulum]|uniref:HNH endonuclease n=1 Tax=Streptoverticillium reticulum TaxID=1433415 RepID=UPI0039BFC054
MGRKNKRKKIPILAARLPAAQAWITDYDLLTHSWSPDMIFAIGRPDRFDHERGPGLKGIYKWHRVKKTHERLVEEAQRRQAEEAARKAEQRRKKKQVAEKQSNPAPSQTPALTLARLQEEKDRRCSVCDKTGLEPGRSRHGRCEGKKRDADSSDTAPLAAPSSTGQSEYRRLVASVEQHERPGQMRRAERVSHDPVRIAAARQAVLLRCEGRCENPQCSGQPLDVTDNGKPILEVDHIKRLADGGRDHPVQMVALCPNCHAMKGRGRHRKALQATLLAVAQQTHARWQGVVGVV